MIEKILRLKKERNAIILAHNYVVPEVQDIADFVGDSYGLSKKASETDVDVIVFCGVHFMAQTAAILCPEKTVLLPEMYSGCPMADMITAHKLSDIKEKHPNAKVVTYINSTADVKAESDIVCTSSNAVQIVKNIKTKEIIFVPDKYLGNFVAKNNPDKNVILYEGYCNVHVKIMPNEVSKLKRKYPKAIVLAHPECRVEVVDLADEALSTSQMLEYAKSSKNDEFIIATEVGILHQLQKDSPNKKFYPASKAALCSNMKKITLEKVLWALEDMKYIVTVEKTVAEKAKLAINKMFEYAQI
jgi:quinolinate synthase